MQRCKAFTRNTPLPSHLNVVLLVTLLLLIPLIGSLLALWLLAPLILRHHLVNVVLQLRLDERLGAAALRPCRPRDQPPNALEGRARGQLQLHPHLHAGFQTHIQIKFRSTICVELRERFDYLAWRGRE